MFTKTRAATRICQPPLSSEQGFLKSSMRKQTFSLIKANASCTSLYVSSSRSSRSYQPTYTQDIGPRRRIGEAKAMEHSSCLRLEIRTTQRLELGIGLAKTSLKFKKFDEFHVRRPPRKLPSASQRGRLLLVAPPAPGHAALPLPGPQMTGLAAPLQT